MAIKVIEEYVIAKLWVFKLIKCQIQANLTTSGLKLAEFGDFKLKVRRILANLGSRRLIIPKFTFFYLLVSKFD